MKKLFDRSGLASIIFMSVIGCFLGLAIDYYLVSNTFSVSEDVAGSYTPGTYTATEDGFEGPVEVTVDIGENGGIKDLTINAPDETPDVGGAAIPLLKKAILEKKCPRTIYQGRRRYLKQK
jgi:fumarate reductase flavoprotein subunit